MHMPWAAVSLSSKGKSVRTVGVSSDSSASPTGSSASLWRLASSRAPLAAASSAHYLYWFLWTQMTRHSLHVTLCESLSARHPLHVTLCTSLSARRSLHVTLCTSLPVRHSLHVTPCMSPPARHSLHVTLCTSLSARHSLHVTLRTSLYARQSLHVTLCTSLSARHSLHTHTHTLHDLYWVFWLRRGRVQSPGDF
jgi:hypothetical protein